MKRKMWLCAVGFTAAALVLVSAAAPASQNDAATRASATTLVVSQQSDPGFLNELLGDEPGALFVHQNVWQELVNLAYDGTTIEPDLATHWKVSQNGLKYTFYLRHGVKWQDGKPFTSADVTYTMNLQKSLPSWAVAYLAGVRKVSAEGPYKVTFTLSKPNAGWLSLFAFGCNWGLNILPKHLYAGTDVKKNKYNQKPIGTGPYEFVNHVSGQYITLKANPHYWGPRPGYKKVVIKIIPSSATALQELQSGAVDYVTTSDNPVAFSQLPPLKSDSKITISHPLESVIIWVMFNTKNPALQNPKVRQALAYAINRSQLARNAYFNYGTPMSGMYLQGKFYNAKATLPYNPTKAKQMLASLGDSHLSLELAYAPLFGMDAVAQLVKAQLANVGVNVTLWSGDYPTWFNKVHTQGNYQMAIRASQIGPDPDSLWQWLSPVHAGESGATYFNNPQMTSLFTRARESTSAKARVKLYDQIQTILQKNAPVVPLVNIEDVNLWRNDRVKGLPPQYPQVATRWSLAWAKPKK